MGILPVPALSEARAARARIKFWPLVAATFFMVSGGTYGTEDIVRGAGYGVALIVLLLTPLLWSVPTALMIAELSSAIPEEGGFYAWVRRGLGDFWGFQESWLSLAASIFDMAIYPTLFVLYLERIFPWFTAGSRATAIGAAMVAICAVLNIAGVRLVADLSLWMFLLLSAPFAAIVLLAPARAGAFVHAAAPAAPEIGIVGGILVAMWNYMGWDNASTVATQVENPQRAYPRALLAAVAIVALSYVLPIAAVRLTGLPASSFGTGFWVDVAGLIGGRWLRVFTAAGAMMSAFGMFNALVLSYSRLPLAMAEDGMLPRMFARVTPGAKTPWVSILVLATAWGACLSLGFERLITLDILLYGASLMLEFATLVALRIRAPELARPFRVPGGLAGAVALGIPPCALLVLALVRCGNETLMGVNALLFGAGVAALGAVGFAGRARRNIRTGPGN